MEFILGGKETITVELEDERFTREEFLNSLK